MRKNYFFSLILMLVVSSIFGQVVINEVDSDQEKTDNSEFIELKGAPNTSLDGHVVVLFNGKKDTSYATYDLDGKTTDANGFFILATTAIANTSKGDIDLGASYKIQNGADAIAIYKAKADKFPNGTSPTKTDLVDALVYGTSDRDDTGLMTALGVTEQVDENVNGKKDIESIQRTPSGSYFVGAPSLRAENNAPTEPSISISSPREKFVFEPGTTEVTVKIRVQNFDFSKDGSIYYTLNRDNETKKSNIDDFKLTGLTAGDYELAMWLADNDKNALNPAVEATVNFTIGSYTKVNDLASLRKQKKNGYYEITGEIIASYVRPESTSKVRTRNQKYFQDATGGILIDDYKKVITTPYSTGDAIKGLKGRLSEYNGVLQLVPAQDPGVATSTGNTITPKVLALADYLKDIDKYESMLLKFENVTFKKASGSFALFKRYEIESNGATSFFGANFAEANYIGKGIPTGSFDLTVLGAEYKGKARLVAINMAGISSLSAIKSKIQGFAVYPNPASNVFKLTTASSATKNITIFNVLGKQVLSQKVEGFTQNINVSNLTSGIYILKVNQDGKIATQKLVIK